MEINSNTYFVVTEIRLDLHQRAYTLFSQLIRGKVLSHSIVWGSKSGLGLSKVIASTLKQIYLNFVNESLSRSLIIYANWICKLGRILFFFMLDDLLSLRKM